MENHTFLAFIDSRIYFVLYYIIHQQSCPELNKLDKNMYSFKLNSTHEVICLKIYHLSILKVE